LVSSFFFPQGRSQSAIVVVCLAVFWAVLRESRQGLTRFGDEVFPVVQTGILFPAAADFGLLSCSDMKSWSPGTDSDKAVIATV
jgi:hypothetical protein